MPGSGQPVQQTQSTKVEMSPEQRQLFNLAFPGIKEWAATTPERYQGSTVAPFNPNQTAGQQGVLDATGSQADIVKGGADASKFWTSGNVWDPANNAALSGAVDAAVRPITQAYTQDYLPAVRSEAIMTGGLGGSRQGVHEVTGAEKMYRAAGDTANKVVQDAYSTNVNAQLKALGLLPQTASAQTIPGATQSAVGDVQQAQTQAGINEAVANWNYDENAGYLQGKDLMSLITGIPGGTTTSTANNPPAAPGGLQALGGAMGGAQLGNLLFPGLGGFAGAGLGAILPFLS